MGLVLNRKDGQSVAIGEGITVKILEAKKGKALILIEAPSSEKIFRTEVLERAKETDNAD